MVVDSSKADGNTSVSMGKLFYGEFPSIVGCVYNIKTIKLIAIQQFKQ